MKEKQSNTTIILKELIELIIKDKSPEKNLYDFFIENHPDILEVVDNEKYKRPEGIVLGMSHPHSSLKPNTFSDEEMKDIS